MAKKKQLHEEHPDETWLIPYADLLTLLLALFIVLFAGGQEDKEKFEALKKAFAEIFMTQQLAQKVQPGPGGSESGVDVSIELPEGLLDANTTWVLPEGSKSPAGSQPGGSGGPATPALTTADGSPAGSPGTAGTGSSGSGTMGTGSGPAGGGPGNGTGSTGGGISYAPQLDPRLMNLKAKLDQYIKDSQMQGQLQTRDETRVLMITINDVILFDPGSAEIKSRFKLALQAIGKLLAENPGLQVQIMGHTDNIPISSARYETNWDLSSDRALTFMKALLKDPRLDPACFSAIGYGEYRPRASNDTEAGRSANRRVEIAVKLLDA